KSFSSPIRFFSSMTMGNNGLPPQAYTKETLADAYEWIKSQGPEVRRAATNSDSLVGLYLSFQRRQQEGVSHFYEKNHSVEMNVSSNPVSGEQFKKELKTLAAGLNEFTDPEEKKTPPPHMVAPTPSDVRTFFKNQSPAVSPTPTSKQPLPRLETSEFDKRSLRAGGDVQAPKAVAPLPPLDALSLQRVQSLRMGLNLSSDTEALRMLITVGFERVKDLIPS
ncbi:MAG: hypothetical protein KDD34_01690, partial [Bdellovibrionales bacterium]|nr:hypothetical protein [Bdellovibrionales bacterium]